MPSRWGITDFHSNSCTWLTLWYGESQFGIATAGWTLLQFTNGGMCIWSFVTSSSHNRLCLWSTMYISQRSGGNMSYPNKVGGDKPVRFSYWRQKNLPMVNQRNELIIDISLHRVQVFNCDQAALWMVQPTRPSGQKSVCHTLFTTTGSNLIPNRIQTMRIE